MSQIRSRNLNKLGQMILASASLFFERLVRGLTSFTKYLKGNLTRKMRARNINEPKFQKRLKFDPFRHFLTLGDLQ